jgi:hypothetical protein
MTEDQVKWCWAIGYALLFCALGLLVALLSDRCTAILFLMAGGALHLMNQRDED